MTDLLKMISGVLFFVGVVAFTIWSERRHCQKDH